MPAVIQETRFSTAVRRRFGVVGPYGLSVIDDVFPVLNLDPDPGTRPDLAALYGERVCHGRILSPAAGAGQFSRVMFGPAVGHSVSLIMRSVRVQAGQGETFTLASPAAVAGTFLGNAQFTDGSAEGGTLLAAYSSTGIAPVAHFGLPANGTRIPVAWVIPAGTSLILTQGVADTALLVDWEGVTIPVDRG